MEKILFPKWECFLGFYLFLRLYSPTRQYLDRPSSLAFSVFFSIIARVTGIDREAELFPVIVASVSYSLFCSVPYLVGGILGAIVQQLLLLNEQSVQDKRFTDESEALSIMGSLIFLIAAIEADGEPLKPLIDVIFVGFGQGVSIDTLLSRVASSLYLAAILSAKYIMLMTVISFMGAYVDLFFQKAGFSSVIISIKAMTVVALLNFWFIHDHRYFFGELLGK